MTPTSYFLIMVLGTPLVLLVIAIFAGRSYRDGYERLLDWKATRSPEREVELDGDTRQMLSALNRYRRLRGAPERSIEQIAAEYTGADLDQDDDC
jgi:hypothetical protein